MKYKAGNRAGKAEVKSAVKSVGDSRGKGGANSPGSYGLVFLLTSLPFH